MRRGLDERTSIGNLSNTSSSSSNFSTYPRRRRQFVDQVGINSNSVVYLTWTGEPVDLNNLNKSLNLSETEGLVSLRNILKLCQKYEAQEITVFLGKEDGSSDFETSSHQYEAVQGLSRTTSSHSTTSHPQPPPASFDSDSSFEDDDDEEGAPPPSGAAPWGTAPQQSKGAMLNEGIYGFMKQASKRMRKADF